MLFALKLEYWDTPIHIIRYKLYPSCILNIQIYIVSEKKIMHQFATGCTIPFAFEANNAKIPFVIGPIASWKTLLHVCLVQLYWTFPPSFIIIWSLFCSFPTLTTIGSSRISSMYMTTLTLSAQLCTTSFMSSPTSWKALLSSCKFWNCSFTLTNALLSVSSIRADDSY